MGRPSYIPHDTQHFYSWNITECNTAMMKINININANIPTLMQPTPMHYILCFLRMAHTCPDDRQSSHLGLHILAHRIKAKKCFLGFSPVRKGLFKPDGLQTDVHRLLLGESYVEQGVLSYLKETCLRHSFLLGGTPKTHIKDVSGFFPQLLEG